jgi:predicted dinucleotide-binding enzyme
MRIGVLGSGTVGQTLAAGFLKHGHEAMVGTRSPDKLASFQAAHPAARVGTFAEAAAHGEVLVLAVKGTMAAQALALAGADKLAGKVVLDATNPIADLPPEGGVLRFFTAEGESLLERLQGEQPRARLVKAFSCVGSAFMVDPAFPGGPPTMFICGDDESAKSVARGILDQFGWETADMGGAVAARAIEPLCMLWCLPGFLRNEWTHAFRLLRL